MGRLDVRRRVRLDQRDRLGAVAWPQNLAARHPVLRDGLVHRDLPGGQFLGGLVVPMAGKAGEEYLELRMDCCQVEPRSVSARRFLARSAM
jgi:hypothetical protein